VETRLQRCLFIHSRKFEHRSTAPLQKKRAASCTVYTKLVLTRKVLACKISTRGGCQSALCMLRCIVEGQGRDPPVCGAGYQPLDWECCLSREPRGLALFARQRQRQRQRQRSSCHWSGRKEHCTGGLKTAQLANSESIPAAVINNAYISRFGSPES